MADPLIEESVAASNIPEASNFVDGPWEMRASDRLINYNVVVRELDPRKRGSRELELKRLGACREQIVARRWAHRVRS